jgi:hypothetical protein
LGTQSVPGGHSPSHSGQNDWSQLMMGGSQRHRPMLSTKKQDWVGSGQGPSQAGSVTSHGTGSQRH